MTRHDCRRCDWRPDPQDTYGPVRVQAGAHAADAEHPLCIVCSRSLEVAEIQSCAECVATVRARLASITERYALLPGELGWATAAPLDRDGAGHPEETSLPGGDALALLSPGSAGRSQVRGVLLPDGSRSTDHEADEHPGDPASVSFELSRWEDDWRIVRGEPAATGPATVSAAAGYLNARLSWAASHHPAFDEVAADLRALAKKLEQVTGASDRPQIGVPCQACGKDLERQYGEDDYKCPRCDLVYDNASYWLAVRSDLEREKERERLAREEERRLARERAG